MIKKWLKCSEMIKEDKEFKIIKNKDNVFTNDKKG